MSEELREKLVRIINKDILTPVIYMIETEDCLHFICFCDRNITLGEIYNTEKKISDGTGIAAEIMDIRDFSGTERLEMLQNAELIYSEHPVIETIFAHSLMEDYRIAMLERKEVLERYHETGSCYLQ